MPAQSKSQFRFMEMLAHNKKRAKEVGMSSEKAKEFVSGQTNYKSLPEKKKRVSKTLSKMKG